METNCIYLITSVAGASNLAFMTGRARTTLENVKPGVGRRVVALHLGRSAAVAFGEKAVGGSGNDSGQSGEGGEQAHLHVCNCLLL